MSGRCTSTPPGESAYPSTCDIETAEPLLALGLRLASALLWPWGGLRVVVLRVWCRPQRAPKIWGPQRAAQALFHLRGDLLLSSGHLLLSLCLKYITSLWQVLH